MDADFCLTLDETSLPSEPSLILGRLRIGDFQERFEAELSYWSAQQYRESWYAAALALLAGDDKAAFFTSMADPAETTYIFWWPAYRSGDDVCLQHHMLFLRKLEPPFDLQDPFRHVRPHRTRNEDGDRISEWRTGIDDIRAFASLLEAQTG